MKRRLLLILLAVFAVLILTTTLVACSRGGSRNTTYIISFNTDGGSEVQSIILKAGESIVLPDPPTKDGYVFTGWYNDRECKRPVNTSIFKANGNMTIFAGWESVLTYPHEITLEEYLEGTVKLITPVENRAQMGTLVVVSVTPSSAYEIASGGVVAVGETTTTVLMPESGNRYQFEMPAEPVTIKVTFTLKSHRITLNPLMTCGTVALGADSARQGEIVTVRAIPDYGYRLVELYMYSSSEGTYTAINDNYFVMRSGNVIIGAEFEPIDYDTLYSIECESSGKGSVSVETDRQAAGVFVEFSVRPEEGYRLVNLWAGGVTLDDDGFIMPAQDVTLKAVFAPADEDDEHYPVTLSASDGVIATADDETSYAAGEEVTLVLNPAEGYEIGSVTVNGSYIEGNTFIMPDEDTVVVAEFVKRGFSLMFSGNMNFKGEISANNAYEGDLIRFDITPNNGFYISMVELVALGDNGNPYSVVELDEYSFVMPAADVFIRVTTIAVGNRTYALKAEETEGGSIELLSDSARYGETVKVNVIACEGYRLEAGSLTLSYISGNTTASVTFGGEFIMPDSDVTVSARFERVYKVGAIDEYNIAVYPSATEIAVGESVQFTATTRGGLSDDYNYGSIELTVSTSGGYSGRLDVSGVFILEAEYAGDVTVSYDEKKYAYVSESSYSSISVANVEGGYLTVPAYYAVYSGTVVPITVVANEGYELKSITLSTPYTSYTVADSFTMPASNVTLTAEFVEAEQTEFTLDALYSRNRDSFAAAGIFLKYYRESYQIRELFGDKKLNSILSYVDGVITARSEYGHDFYVIEVKSLMKVTAITQRAVERILNDYPEGAEADVVIDYNFVIVSVNGNADEDKQMLLNGIKQIDNCILYKRADGSYGLYAYVGNADYVNLMQSYSGRIISYIAPYAFAVRGADVLGITLGHVRVLDDFALCGLANVRYVYLGNVESVGKGVFAGCSSLEYIGVSKYNSALVTGTDGVLYGVITSNKYSLIAYPAGKDATEYKLDSKCVEIMPYAFLGADTLVRVGYGGNLTAIGDHAFKDCSSLSEIYYGNAAESSILKGTAALDNTNSVITSVGEGAFEGCSLITTYRFDKLTFVGEGAVSWDGEASVTVWLNTSAVSAAGGIPITVAAGAVGGNGKLVIHAGNLAEAYSEAEYWRELTEYFE